jgi:hypothetical protein
MSIEVIDGTIETAIVKRSDATLVLYECIVIRTVNGLERRLAEVEVAPEVAEMLKPRIGGRFYASRTNDQRGLLAVRTSDGRAAFAIPSDSERFMLVTAIAGYAGFALLMLLGWGLGLLLSIVLGVLALLSLTLSVLSLLGSESCRQTRIEGQARYDADAEYS